MVNSKLLILDIDNFTSNAEADIIRRSGFEMQRLSSPDLASLRPAAQTRIAVLRSERLEAEAYATLYSELRQKDIVLVNDPEASERASDFALQYPLISGGSPRSLVCSSQASASEVLTAISEAGVKFPVFIKSDRKSLKQRSIVSEPAVDLLKDTVSALTAEFAPFKTFVIKEVLSLEPDDSRGVVFRNSLVTFDTGPLTGDPDFPKSTIYHFFSIWMGRLAAARFADFYVMDIAAVKGTSTFVIVEIKDAQFTKIKRPDIFWPALAQVADKKLS